MSLRWKKITEPNLAKSEREEKLWLALKRHILLERKRKKEELEAEVEEERQRKEREAREKQDVMTLGETRDQILLLETKLQGLRNEKQQLFLQLKKVLNEDDNRKRQMHKETEMFAMQQQAQPGPHPQLFLPPRVPQQPILHKSNATVPASLKRNRSPSPTQISYYKPNQQYHAPKLEENRRGPEVARAVLWNKSAQYSTPGTLFYPSNPPLNPVQDSRSQPIIYPTYSPTIISCAPPNRVGGGGGGGGGGANYHAKLQEHQQQQMKEHQHQQQQQQSKNEMMGGKNPPPANVYHINLDQHKSHQGQPITIEKIQERGGYHIDDRKDMRQQASQPGPQHLPEGIVYTTSMRPGQILHPHSMVPMPPNQQQMNNFQKGGGIPQNYQPNRPTNAPPNPHQQPPPGHYPRHRY